MKFKQHWLSILCVAITFQLFGQTNKIELSYQRNKDNSVDFYYKKNAPGTYTIKLQFKQLSNANASDFTTEIVGSYGLLTSLRPINKQQGIGFSYTYSYILGTVNPSKLDSLFVYVLPFKTGSEIQVQNMYYLNEAYFGSEKPINWKAFEFIAPEQDTVYAIRKGIVVDLKDNFELDSISHFTSNLNSILIEHLDGTYALYSGFSKKGIFVKLGEMVYPHSAVGILRDKKTNYLKTLRLVIYYNTAKGIENYKHLTLSTQNTTFKGINPFFQTSEGAVQLYPIKKYKVIFNDELFFKEFSKREIKKYLKKLNQ